MFYTTKKLLNARQAAQKARDAEMEYFEIRYAIRSGDKNAAAMVDSYARHYSAWSSNIAALRSYLEAQS